MPAVRVVYEINQSILGIAFTLAIGSVFKYPMTRMENNLKPSTVNQYTINIVGSGVEPICLLIPFPTTSTLLNLLNEIRRRGSLIQLILPGPDGISLHLKRENDPLLDYEDLIGHVVLDPNVEVITAVCRTMVDAVVQMQEPRIRPSHSLAEETFKIRVITPFLARAHANRNHIPIIPGSVTTQTTLQQLKSLIASHLGLDVRNFVQFHEECNCCSARHIYENALANEATADGDTNSPTKLIVISSASHVVVLNIDADAIGTMVDRSSIINRLRLEYGDMIDSKEVNLIGRIPSPIAPGAYIKLPVVAICSKARHNVSHAKVGLSSHGQYDKYIDIHTSEAFITITDVNINKTLEQLCFPDLATNGVIDLYVVERWEKYIVTEEPGMDDIFMISEAWHHPIRQSDFGMAMMLSTLRVFCHVTSAKSVGRRFQDAVLHIIFILTRFPPAIRAFYTLMSGNCALNSDRAVLCQTIYEMLKDVVPPNLIQCDPQKCLEWTNRLFGLIIEKAKHVKIQEEGTQLPYLSSLRVMDLRSAFTMEAVINPVLTSIGLVERGFYDALRESRLFRWTNGDEPRSLSSYPIDHETKRVIFLSGALVNTITVLDLQNVRNKDCYLSAATIATPRELGDFKELSAFASRNKLSVVPRAKLPVTDDPVLTFDHDGLPSVFVGWAACTEPGKYISIFRPTANGEEIVAVAKNTPPFVSMLQHREPEAITILDASEDEVRQVREPDEVLMVVVDCSRSMGENSDFVELEGNNDMSNIDSIYKNPNNVGDSVDCSAMPNATLEEVKICLRSHESLTDIIATIQAVSSDRRRDVAMKLLGIWHRLVSDRLGSELKEHEGKMRGVPRFYRHFEDVESQRSRTKLRIFIAGLNKHIQALCDFLIYRAANSKLLDNNWEWKVGDAIPKIPKPPHRNHHYFRVPSHFLCPISQEIMDDPASTCDGLTFERKNIERWFQIRKSSPFTGLALDSDELKVNVEIANQIQVWVGGNEIIATQPQPNSRWRPLRSPRLISLEFFSSLGNFKKEVPSTLSIESLYELAFRGLKGRMLQLLLYFNNQPLSPSRKPLSSTQIRDRSTIHISCSENDAAGASSPKAGKEQLEALCLIKVHGDCDNSQFLYWTKKDNRNTLASVIFRTWRRNFTENPLQPIQDLMVGIVKSDDGDGHLRGFPQNHWDKLDQMSYSCQVIQRVGTHVFELSVGRRRLRRGENKNNRNYLSRLDVLKIMFDAFFNRLLAYNLQTHIGLITFQTTATISQKITYAVEDFRHRVNSMSSHGDTALWDAILLASDQIIDYTKKFPNSKRRIICFSDGRDNRSMKESSDLSVLLSRNNIAVDSFCLGLKDNKDLQTLSYLSGGYKFTPKSLEQAIAICEMEPVLSSLERPDLVLPHDSDFSDHFQNFISARQRAIPEVVTADVFPQRKTHHSLDDSFVLIPSMTGNTQVSGLFNAHSDANLRTSRILTEIRNILANPHTHYDVYFSESNMSFWKVVMQGPPESAYSTGTFVLYIDMEEDYPKSPPKCRFITPIYHPSISRHGKVCHRILDRKWRPDTTNLRLIKTIYSLLLAPEFSDPINNVITLSFLWDEVAFNEEARIHTQKNATMTRGQWKAEILGEGSG